jgi:hypothetical protein
MKRFVRVSFITALVVFIGAGTAQAASDSRKGVNFSGIRNPGGCLIRPDLQHPTWLEVKCSSGVGATGKAFVRYRFLRNVGAIQASAVVRADMSTWHGKPAHIEWMVRKRHVPARTARITIPFGTYVDIRSVSWSQ